MTNAIKIDDFILTDNIYKSYAYLSSNNDVILEKEPYEKQINLYLFP